MLHLIVAGDVDLDAGSALVHPIADGRAVRVRWPDSIDARAEVRDLDDPLLTEVWGPRLTRLALPLASRTTFRLTVELDTPTEDTP